MNALTSFTKFALLLSIIFIFSITISAQHQHGSDTTKTEIKKMDCCKKMRCNNHKMKAEIDDSCVYKKNDLEKLDINKNGKVFVDLMCPDVVKDEPGNCPKCGMELKEVSLDKAKKYLKKHGINMKNKN